MSTFSPINTAEQKVSFADVKEVIANSSYGADYHRRQVSNISGTSSNSRVVRKIVHYENPRQYISFDYKQGANNSYQQQQIGYTQGQQSCNSGNGNNCNCCKVSVNPLYQFKATNELDIKYRIEKQEQLDELLSRLAHLEQTHLEEIEKLKAAFMIERQSYERQLVEKSSQVQEKIVYVPQRQDDSGVNYKQEELDQCKEELKIVKAALQESELSCSSLQQQLALKEITLNHLKESDRTNELNATIEELRTKYETLREEQMELKEKHIVQSSTDKSQISSLEVRLEGVLKELANATEKLRNLDARNSELEKESIELRVLRESYGKHQSSSESAKSKKKEIKITLNEAQATLLARTEELEKIKIELYRREEEILNLKSLKAVQTRPADNAQELAEQNQYLINELGKLTEAYNQLERSGKIIEKPIFVETVKNITTVKEVPAKIEERTIYVQDTAELERLHAIIRELEQEIIKLNDEKQILQAEYYAEKKQLLNASFAGKQQSSELKQSQVIREVIVERQIDRSEVLQKEELLRRAEAELAEEKIRNAQLQHSVESLTLQLSRLQLNYKIVKLPNSYKLESSSISSNLQEQHEITLRNNTYSRISSNNVRFTQSQPYSAANYDISHTLHGIQLSREQQPHENTMFTEKKENIYIHKQGQEENSQEFMINDAPENNHSDHPELGNSS